MKRKMFLMLVLISVFCFTSYSQCLALIQSANGDIWGYLNGTSIYDNSSDKILDFSTPGVVGDMENNALATFNAETGQVLDQNSDLVMTIEANGDIKDGQGDLMAHIDEYGVMRDTDNYFLVSITGAEPLYIAYYYFFYRYY